MATFVPVSEILAAIETDEQDSTLLRMIGAAERDVVAVTPSNSRPDLPVAAKARVPLTLERGDNAQTITFTDSVRGKTMLRFDGKFSSNDEPFWCHD